MTIKTVAEGAATVLNVVSYGGASVAEPREGKTLRIGIDMLAVQSPWTGRRGIGRLSHELVAALIERDRVNSYVLYGYEGIPTDLIPRAEGVPVVLLKADEGRGERTIHDAADRLVRENPDQLDVYLVLSPLDLFGGYAPPVKPLNGLTMAAYVYDAIPFLFQEQYLAEPRFSNALYRSFERLRRYDVLLTCSNATRADVTRLLGLPLDRVVTVGCDAGDSGLVPDRSEPLPSDAARVLSGLGIERPFVFNLGGADEQNDRKNLFGLVDAFGRLSDPLREAHQLVIGCALNDSFRERLINRAVEHGVAGRLVLTGALEDDALRVLYQRCAVFAFPSLYEGFGLPLLEAMRCGAAVVAGNNSSQPEVVGDAGLLANALDAADIAEKLSRVLSDPALARDLGHRAEARARQFDWAHTARAVIDALTAAPEWSLTPIPNSDPVGARDRAQRRRNPGPRPRIALFSPFPPKVSGVSDYANALVHELKSDYLIDLYHDGGYVPEPALASPEFGSFDHRLFGRRAEAMNYHATLYQMGNSVYHGFVYEALLRHPGLVTLHDFSLAGFQFWHANLPGSPPGEFARRVKHHDPARASDILDKLDDWASEPGGVPSACVRERVDLNRSIFECAERVIVHSSWCKAEVGRLFPESLDQTEVVPLGANPEVITPERRAEVRARFDLPSGALVFGAFGFLTPSKMNEETVEAFAALVDEFPEALLIFVGQDWGGDGARRRAAELGLETRVRFLGRQSSADYADLAASVDIGVCLRRPPTHGETSAALLDLLRRGVPTVVTDVGTFSGYPDAIVRKVRWTLDGSDALKAAFRELAADPARRSSLGRAALSYVANHHSWPIAAARYVELIERCHAERRNRRPDRGAGRATPHVRRLDMPLTTADAPTGA